VPLEIQNIIKSYPPFSVCLNFTVNDGETLALVGPSGCGKTTALNLIAGLLTPESGDILSNGEDIGALPPWKRNIAFVFQDLALFPNMDVGKNIGFSPFIKGVQKKERRRIVEEAMRIVHLPPHFAKRRIATLSGGERQRVAIARSLASSPCALLMDEPFSSLDTPLRHELWLEFRNIRSRSRIPCIFVTHDKEEASIISTKIALMIEGHIVEIATTHDMLHTPKTEAAATFFGLV
jgi:putative spermidine/putrescine transport system ATP-binding protein